MGLFEKRKAEARTAEGAQKEALRQKNQYDDNEPTVDVIVCNEEEMDNATFVWKYPGHHFNTMSQLIVQESQEAIFFLNGEALDSFKAGRYTLETQNIPQISKKVFGGMTGGAVPFQSDVYFVNMTEQMAIKWGTDSKVEYMEPTYHFPVKIGACGEMSLKVSNARKLLINLVGTEIFLSRNTLVSYFRALLMTRVKAYISRAMTENKINIFDIDSHLDVFSDVLRDKLKDDFEEYGLSLKQFLVTTVQKPDDQMYNKFKNLFYSNYTEVAEARLRQQVDVIDAQTQAQKMVILSQAMATKRAQEGYTYQEERNFQVASKLADNEALGNFTNMGIGLGAMTGVGMTLGSSIAGMAADAVHSAVQPKPADNAFLAQQTTENSNVAQAEGGNGETKETGIEISENSINETKGNHEDEEMNAFEKKVQKLKLLFNQGILSEEEFTEEKKKLLESL